MKKQLTTCLWFDKEAEEAGNFYVNLFNEGGHEAKLGAIARYSKSGSMASGQPEGSAMTVSFELDGQKFMGLNGGQAPWAKFSGGTSFVVTCNTQEEIDHFWSKLSEGGQEGQCGWINYDKFGLTWQIVPAILAETMSSSDPETAERVMKAMLSMKKINIAELEKARDEK